MTRLVGTNITQLHKTLVENPLASRKL